MMMMMNSGKKKKKKGLDAEDGIKSIGLGYDVTNILRLQYCKYDSRLIAIDHDNNLRTVELPDGVSIPNVPKSIKCYKGDHMRLCSDSLSFQQMSEQFNKEVSLSGKIPTGHFNAAFQFSGVWHRDAAKTKSLAFDGVFITLYNIALEKTQLVLHDHVKQAIPSSWDPAALAGFIEKYGTHVVVGVKIGGTDIIYAKQPYSSPLQPADVQKTLKDLADELFIRQPGQLKTNVGRFTAKGKLIMENGLGLVDIHAHSGRESVVQDVKFRYKRKGGNETKYLNHNEWCQTVLSEPDVISMSFIPITSLLGGISGSGYLTHAINLYIRYKPPIEELHQFFEFQLPRQWAPALFGELTLGPERKSQNSTSLQFSFMGPKLYVNTVPVNVGQKPVTGLRLYLEGKKSNRLAIHLQHLSSLPKTFQLQDEPIENVSNAYSDRRYYENVQWKNFSHICTAPIESYNDNSVVIGAHFEVGETGTKKVLFLRLHFSEVAAATHVRASEWAGSPGMTQKSGIISTLISTSFFSGPQNLPPPQPSNVNFKSALYPRGPPVAAQSTKLLRFVDTTEVTTGPQDLPGYWVVSGARLVVEKGKISLRVKFSLLPVILSDDDDDDDEVAG